MKISGRTTGLRARPGRTRGGASSSSRRVPADRSNVHVRVAGAPNQRYALLFRDYLRAHPESAAAYARLKRALAALGIEPGVYAEVKDPACDLIFIAAEDWAVRSDWALR